MKQQVCHGEALTASSCRRLAAAVGAAAFLLAVSTIRPSHAAAEDAKSGPPTFKPVWKMDLPAGTQRVAVADVTEDKLPRLLVLSSEGTLSIQKLSGDGAKEEASVPLGAGAERFAVGHFSKGKPAQIVVPTAVFYREGETYRKKALPDLKEVTGSIRFEDGSEGIFVLTEGEGPPNGHELDLGAEKPVKAGREISQPKAEGNSFREIIPHLPPRMFENAPFPEEVKKGGLLRLIAPRSDKRLYAVFSWQAADGSYVAVVGGGDLFPDPVATMKPLWKSPKLEGKVLDIALGPDPKGGTGTGMLVLTQAGADGKGRRIEFFAMEP